MIVYSGLTNTVCLYQNSLVIIPVGLLYYILYMQKYPPLSESCVLIPKEYIQLSSASQVFLCFNKLGLPNLENLLSSIISGDQSISFLFSEIQSWILKIAYVISVESICVQPLTDHKNLISSACILDVSLTEILGESHLSDASSPKFQNHVAILAQELPLKYKNRILN